MSHRKRGWRAARVYWKALNASIDRSTTQITVTACTETLQPETKEALQDLGKAAGEYMRAEKLDAFLAIVPRATDTQK